MITIRDELAEYTHKTWSGWMIYLFKKSDKNPDGSVTISKWAVDRWQRQMNISYDLLSDAEKLSDLGEADEILAVIEYSDNYRATT